jgi:hypothetical protein
MKAEINCPILTSEKFSKEVLGDIVTSLEKLENIKQLFLTGLILLLQKGSINYVT